FRNNFIERLKRLDKIYSENEDSRAAILRVLSRLALKRNWAGAFAELSAYDYLNQRVDAGRRPTVLNKIPGVTTLARYCGKGKAADLDCYFEDFDVYMDVKVLADNVRQLLDGIYDDLKDKLGRSDFYISEDRPLDLDSEVVEHHRAEVLDELINVFKASEHPRVFRSKAIPQILFRFAWESGWHGSFKFYDPYLHAQASHKLAFKHANKYVERKPFLLLFVIFPWFNGIISNFGGSNKIFYRSFSRRVFCGYMKCRTPFKTLKPDFSSNLTVRSVSKKLSGIIFLEDYSLTSNGELNKTYSAYVYLNSNADNSLLRSAFRDYLFSLPRIEYDDFEFDNY
ncbi:MAG TPA: hypothetical protein VE843_16650, partial [Ktedonobacteraceae bacterium]|nr:hypothetical protein [Ktedonobacteraceae bacterium]